MGDGVEQALHCVMVLGALPDDALLPAKALAEFHDIPQPYLLKHLQALTRAKVVSSVSGPQGGYRLARAAREITLLDVVQAIDGAEPAFRCTDLRRRGPGAADDPCAFAALCVIHRRMLAAEEAWRASLREETIADLVAEFGFGIDPRNVGKAMQWLRPRVRTRPAIER